MKMTKFEDAFGKLIDRHQRTTGHRVATTFWDADCSECYWGVYRAPWGQPFATNALGGFHIQHSYRHRATRGLAS